MANQEQFLDVIDCAEAQRRFHAALSLVPLAAETISLDAALGRVLAEDVVASVDVPSFDRSNVDGYAIQASDTETANELLPGRLLLLPSAIPAGCVPEMEVQPGQAIEIATGGMLPRGADAVLMVEHTEESHAHLIIRRAVTPGSGISFAGSDISIGETVLRGGTLLTSRETCVLAALGQATVQVRRQPRVAIISTGNELIPPGRAMQPSCVFDSNSQVLADAVRELGGVPLLAGIVPDDLPALRTELRQAISAADVILLSGGTSKGRGDVCYQAVTEFNDPGVIVHGVALKPGKPICIAVTQGKPVVVLPGFPTSAIFTFHEFIAPILLLLAGRQADKREFVQARLAVKTISDGGRTEFLLVGLVPSDSGLSAFPMGKGSGSVTVFGNADGFVTIPRTCELLNAGQQVQVRLLGRELRTADLVVIGSHCLGLDYLLSQLQRRGWMTKLMNVGSSAGLQAAERGQCDVAGIHLLDAHTGSYNQPFVGESLVLLAGYGRSQGLVFRPGDQRFQGKTPEQIVAAANEDPTIAMVNRNQGSGTRILIDRLLAGRQPRGYAMQPSNHSAVAAAIQQGRADWGMAIEGVATANQLAFVPVQAERFDFAIPKARMNRPVVQAFIQLLAEEDTRIQLHRFGFRD